MRFLITLFRSSTAVGRFSMIGAGVLASSWFLTIIYRVFVRYFVGTSFESAFFIASFIVLPVVALLVLICSLVEVLYYKREKFGVVLLFPVIQVGHFFYMVHLLVAVYGA